MKQKRLRKRHRIKKRKPLIKHTLFGGFLFFFLLFIAGSYFFAFNLFFQVDDISITDAANINEDVLENLIEDRVKKKFFFIETRSIFLFSLEEIEREVLDKAPFVGGVYIERVFPNKLEVRIKERRPMAFWCKRKDKERCFFIDKEGVAFERTERLSTERPIIVKEGTLGEDSVIMEKGELSSIFMISDHFSRKDFPANFFEVKEEGEVVVHTREGVKVYFALNDLKRALDNLEIVLGKKLTREEVKALEYIDLRFGDRIYYK